MSSVVEQIKDRISIVDVVGAYVKLEKAGSNNFKGSCPFHNEKTPSFFISPDRGTYYCFGCGAKGDIFSFIQQFESVEFPQALATLAERANVSLAEREGERDEDKQKQKLHVILEAAVIFFERLLADTPAAKKYLSDRGLKEKTIQDWRIGYAGAGWRGLYDHLLANGYSVQDMLAAGLIKRTANSSSSSSQDGFYDVFRSRIIFPIWNASGKIVGFSGRIFPNDDSDSVPKYLNSPETALFKKSDVIHGFDRAKASIRKKAYSIVVEGQMDLLMSHQAGFTNTVATSGTALSDLHLKRLMRISPRVMFVYDSDNAGISAARRAAELGLCLGLEVKIASLPAGEDPASLLLKNPGVYAAAIKNSEHIIDFSVAAIVRSTTNERERIRKIRDEIFPLLLFFKNSVDRSYFLKRIAGATGVREESLWEDLKTASKTAGSVRPAGAKVAGVNTVAGAKAAPGAKAPASRKYSIERTILGVIYWQQNIAPPIYPPQELLVKLKSIIGEERFALLQAEIEPEREKLIFEVEKYLEGSAKGEEIVKELLKDLQTEELKRQFAKTMSDLRQAEQNKDSTGIERLLKQCNDLSSRLTALEKNK